VVTTTQSPRPAPVGPAGRREAVWRPGPIEVFVVLAVVAVVARGWLIGHTASPRVLSWLTIFASIVIQATPFVVLGTVASAAIAVLVPPAFFARALPRRPALAVPVAGVAGVVLPGCECGSVPIAGAQRCRPTSWLAATPGVDGKRPNIWWRRCVACTGGLSRTGTWTPLAIRR
jgi:hypothetical protein